MNKIKKDILFMTNSKNFNNNTICPEPQETVSKADCKTSELPDNQNSSQQLPKTNSTRKYRKSIFWKSMMQVLFTLSALILCYALGIYFLKINYLYSLALAFPTAMLTVRAFILQHDCGHRSLFSSPELNRWVGRGLGILTLTPFTCWKRFHFMHHACSGNLDKRGFGEVKTLTTNEYQQESRSGKFFYRVYRNPIVLFFLIPPLLFIIRQRLTYYIPKSWVKERRSVYLNNLMIVAILLLTYRLEMFLLYLVFWLFVMAIAASIGVWLFYVQHQFSQAYWRHDGEWSFVDASLKGSVFYDLPDLLHWLTAYIGFHHIHHFDCNIPNYRLKECFSEVKLFQKPYSLTFRESIGCIHLKLWDIERNIMVGFKQNRPL